MPSQIQFKLHKTKNETLKDFCFNNHLSKEHQIVLLTNKFIKRISVENQLFCKQRTNNSFYLSEEDYTQDNFQFDIKKQPIHFQILYLQLQNHQKIAQLNNNFGNSVLDIEGLNIVISHPNDNSFLAAGKGIIYLLNMINLEKKQEFYTQQNGNIVQLKFSQNGDRFGCLDENGNLYIFKINYQYPYNKPINQFPSSNKKSITDFTFLNQGSIFVATSQLNKPSFYIYDTFLPLNDNIEQIGGQWVLYSEKFNMLIFVKKNSIVFYDKELNSVTRCVEIQSDIKCCLLNKNQTIVVIGNSDGYIYFYSLQNFDQIVKLFPFKSESQKKNHAIKQMAWMEDILLASCTSGILSLVYPSVI